MFNKMEKEGVGNCRVVGLPSVSGQVRKEIFLGSIAKHTKEKNVKGSIQHGVKELKSCLSLLTVFHIEITLLVDEGRSAAVAYVAFSKGFDAPSNDMVIQKLRKYRIL